MKDYISILRLNVCLMTVIALIIGYLVSGSFLLSAAFLFAIISAFLICGAGNVINDCFDYKIDKINKPSRPIPSGRISRNNAINYFIVLLIAGLIISYFVSIQFFGLALFNSLILILYSKKLKNTAAIGNVADSWLAASSFIAGGLVYNTVYSIPTALIVLAFIAFFGNMSREIFKDIEDVKGDKKFGLKTIPIKIGELKARMIASAILLIAVLLLLFPYQLKFFSNLYFIGTIPAIFICLASIFYYKSAHESQKLIKIAMYLIFLGFILGTVL